MGIIVDLIIIAALLLFIFLGYKKGLTGSLIKLLSFVIAIVLTLMLYKPVTNMIIEKTEIDEKIRATITETFKKDATNSENNDTTEKNNGIIDNLDNEMRKVAEESQNKLIDQVTIVTINIGSFIAIYLVIRLVLLVVSLFVRQITKLPIIKQVDKVGGIVYGALEGIVVIYVILSIIAVTSVIWTNNPAITAISKSVLGEMLYNHNFIVNLMFK